MLLARAYKAQGLVLHGVLVLQKGVRNYGEYSDGGRRGETGDDEELKQGLAVGAGDARGVPDAYGFILPAGKAAGRAAEAEGKKREEKKKPPAKGAPSVKSVVPGGGRPRRTGRGGEGVEGEGCEGN